MRTIKERDIPRLLTLERQFCTRCWSTGKRVRVCSQANRIGRTDAEFRRLRRRLVATHYRTEHPGMEPLK